jgi:hypothetical protein
MQMAEWLGDIQSLEQNFPWLSSVVQESVQLCPEYSIIWSYYFPDRFLQVQARKQRMYLFLFILTFNNERIEQSMDLLIERLCSHMKEESSAHQEFMEILYRLLRVFTWMKGKTSVLNDDYLKIARSKFEAHYHNWHARIVNEVFRWEEEDPDGRRIERKQDRLLQSIIDRTEELKQYIMI